MVLASVNTERGGGKEATVRFFTWIKSEREANGGNKEFLLIILNFLLL